MTATTVTVQQWPINERHWVVAASLIGRWMRHTMTSHVIVGDHQQLWRQLQRLYVANSEAIKIVVIDQIIRNYIDCKHLINFSRCITHNRAMIVHHRPTTVHRRNLLNGSRSTRQPTRPMICSRGRDSYIMLIFSLIYRHRFRLHVSL